MRMHFVKYGASWPLEAVVTAMAPSNKQNSTVIPHFICSIQLLPRFLHFYIFVCDQQRCKGHMDFISHTWQIQEDRDTKASTCL